MNALTPPAVSAAYSALPPLSRHGERRDGLDPVPRRLLIGAILLLHLAAVCGLLQIREVREAVAEAAPMFVSILTPPAPPKPVAVPPPPVPRPVQKTPPPPTVIAAAPSPAPAPFVVPAPVPQVAEPIAAPAPPVVAAPAPAPTPAPAPKIIPASSVQYLEPISLEYPRLSKRLGETGHVLIRLYIDESGKATNVQVNRSSGHPRLDEAALAAIQKARFRPYTENGVAVAGWAFIPLEFELEK
jgi:protein TonB